jgi:ABC-type lipoprotein release transport system permease subunit
VGAVWFVARAEMRHRWIGALVLVVLVGIVGGAVLASVAGARRTASSLSRFESATGAATLEFSVGDATRQQIDEFRRERGVADLGVLRQMAIFNTDLGFLPTGGPIDHRWGRTIDRPRLVEGRIAHGAHELDIGPGLAKRAGLEVGDTVTFQSFTDDDVRTQSNTSSFDPHGPSPSLHIVGIVRRPLDVGARGDTGGVLVMTRAFMHRYRHEIGTFSGKVIRVRTEHGDADVHSVTRAARRIFGQSADFATLGLGVEGEGAQSAIDITTAALWVLAGVSAAAGVVAIAFALARRMTEEADDDETLRALGLGQRQRWTATTGQVVPIALAGAALSVALAWLMSPLFPIGVGRDAEPDPGLRFDATALLLGAVAVALAVLTVAAVTAAVVTRRRLRATARPSRAARAVNDAGAAPPVAVGIGFALGRSRGRSVPVWSTVGAITIGVVGVVAALVFASSLDRLVNTPARYGWTWGVVLDGYGNTVGGQCPDSDPLTNDARVTALSEYCYAGNLAVAGRPVTGSSFRHLRGRIEPTIVHGRAPRNPREVALGAKLLEATGHSIGDQVVVTGRHDRKYDVVGSTVLPGLGEAQPLAGGALFTVRGLERVARTEDIDNYVVVRLDPDADQRALFHRLAATHAHLDPISASLPAEIARLRQIDTLPAILAGLTVLIALIAIGYTLIVSVRRRRRDLAILRTVGFTRAQVRAAVAWQATTLAVLGVLLGLIVGAVVGDQIWHAVADDIGVSPSIAVPALGLVLLVPITILVANLIAAMPARSAARTPPAVVLRAE